MDSDMLLLNIDAEILQSHVCVEIRELPGSVGFLMLTSLRLAMRFPTTTTVQLKHL